MMTTESIKRRLQQFTGVLFTVLSFSHAYSSTAIPPALPDIDAKNMALNKAIMEDSTNFAVSLAVNTWTPLVYQTLQDIKTEVRWHAEYAVLQQIARSLEGIHQLISEQSYQPQMPEDIDTLVAEKLSDLLNLSAQHPRISFTLDQGRLIIQNNALPTDKPLNAIGANPKETPEATPTKLQQAIHEFLAGNPVPQESITASTTPEVLSIHNKETTECNV